MCATAIAGVAERPANHVAGALIRLNDNGAWSWFMDERVVVEDGKLIVGSVRAVSDFKTGQADPSWGNVEIAVCDLASGATRRTVLHSHFEQDDHDNPAFLRLPDNRYLAMYTKHGVERRIYYRFSEPGNPLAYTGLAALHPNDPSVVYISTDADPATGAPLVSSGDGKRHHELFRGASRDLGKTWVWEPITSNSTVDNLRPIVPKWKDPRTALVWMRGTYLNNHGEWTTAVVALILPPAAK